MQTKFKNEMIKKVLKDPQARKKLMRESHFWFFHICLNQYVKYPTANMHREMFEITEDENKECAVITAFRGSAKSTIMTLSYPLWAILGKQQKKFVLILSQTQSQARLHLANIRRELEANEVLSKALGPFREEKGKRGAVTLIIPEHNARITAASSEESIRGIRHGAFRPDLIICDDVEDLNSVKTKEGRDKTYRWLKGDIIPAGDRDTKVIIIGNLLHKDSLLMRLKDEIKKGTFSGIYKEYPLIDDKGKCLWPGKFPDKKTIKTEKSKIGDPFSWSREFLLHIVDDREPVIHEDWIHRYKEIPEPRRNEHSETVIGIDLAISEKDTGDFTAMVSAKIIGSGDEIRIYILPNPINAKLSFPEIVEHLKMLVKSYGDKFETTIYVEEAMLQGYLTQQLKNEDLRAEGFKIGTIDKRTRLAMASNYIRSGRVLFPEHGAEELIQQMLGFGIEKHDDLVDALTTMLLKIIEQNDTGEITRVVHAKIDWGEEKRPSLSNMWEFLDWEDRQLYGKTARRVRGDIRY